MLGGRKGYTHASLGLVNPGRGLAADDTYANEASEVIQHGKFTHRPQPHTYHSHSFILTHSFISSLVHSILLHCPDYVQALG